jgi:hypothetical protein
LTMRGSGAGSTKMQGQDHGQGQDQDRRTAALTDITTIDLPAPSGKNLLQPGAKSGEHAPVQHPPQTRLKNSSAHNLSQPTNPFLAVAEPSNHIVPALRLAFARVMIPRRTSGTRTTMLGMIGIAGWKPSRIGQSGGRVARRGYERLASRSRRCRIGSEGRLVIRKRPQGRRTCGM